MTSLNTRSKKYMPLEHLPAGNKLFRSVRKEFHAKTISVLNKGMLIEYMVVCLSLTHKPTGETDVALLAKYSPVIE